MDKVYLAYNRMGRRGLRGAGDPNSVLGTPSRAGLRYLDASTRLVYRSRNVLNFNDSAYITIPTISTARKVNLQFWHNAPSPANFDAIIDGVDGSALRTNVERLQTTGVLSSQNCTMILDGVGIANNATNPSASVWHTLQLNRGTNGQVRRLGCNTGATIFYNGRIANVQILGAGDTLLASYAINEGTGTTIIDSSGNGRNGTLTLGSGSWELSWVPI